VDDLISRVNPWTGYITWKKTSTSSSKPLNWQFTSESSS
jgi:hypothetical protein